MAQKNSSFRSAETGNPGCLLSRLSVVTCWMYQHWFGQAGASGWPPVQLNVSPTSTVADVLLAGAHLEWEPPWGDASYGWVHPPCVEGKEALVWESRPSRGEPFWRSVVGMTGLDMCVPQGTERHSRASSASKVSEEWQKCLLLALGQLGTGRIFLSVINKWFHP